MTGAYSNDLRQRVVDAVLSGATCSVAADRFGVSHFGVFPLISHQVERRYRQKGDIAPNKRIYQGKAHKECSRTQ